MKDGNRFRLRVLGIGGLFLLSSGAILARSVDLQVTKMDDLRRMADRQYIRRIPLVPARGSIRDRHGNILAQTTEVDSLYARPEEFVHDPGAERRLAGILGLPYAEIIERLGSDRPFVWLQRQVSPQMVETLKALGVDGIGFIREGTRFYPNRGLAGQVLGMVGLDAKGLEGAELQFDDVLRGPPKSLTIERDARGRDVLAQEPEDGGRPSDVYLTLDTDVQFILEKELADGVAWAGARRGVAVAMDPSTGEVLGLAVTPLFNPNSFSVYSPEAWRDRGVTDAFEPGSTFKVFLLAAALEATVARPDDIFYCENGAYAVGENVIKDDERKYGWLSLKQIIKVSSNIGASKVGEKLGRDRFYRFITAFGFGEKTGIDLPGESRGMVHPARHWPRVSLRTISFGQGVSVTPIQMAAALSSIANGGLLMKPLIFKKIVDSDGRILSEDSPSIVRRVTSTQTARTVTSVLRAVVEEGGTGERAGLPGYDVAGKTGTAQVPDPVGGGYLKDKHIASFMGFFPAETPRIVLFVMLDRPRVSPYGGVVAAPVFRRIAEKLAVILDIPPAHDFARRDVHPLSATDGPGIGEGAARPRSTSDAPGRPPAEGGEYNRKG